MSAPVTRAAAGEGLLRRLVTAAADALGARAAEIDDLNVFPVADGDTGTNMSATARAVERALEEAAGVHGADLGAAVARAALMGARGNSGMILSQMVRGAAETLAIPAGDPARGVARALRSADACARAAVRRPVEGTMLTVIARAADAAEAMAGADAAPVLDAAAAAAWQAVEATTGQLEALRRAGVVDAGGVGVAVLLEAMAAALAGREAAVRALAPPPVPAGEHAPSRHRWCTTFLVEGDDADPGALEAALAAAGDSLLAVGGGGQVKVHIHTDAPERAAALARPWGEVTGMRAEDMRRQEAERARRLAPPAPAATGCAAVALADGAGVRALAEGLGARALPPGEEVEVSLGEGGLVVVCDAAALPAARAAAGRAGAPLVAAPSVPALLSALVAFDPGRGAEDNAVAMRAAAGAVRGARFEATTAQELRKQVASALLALLPEGPHVVTAVLGSSAPVAPHEVEAWVREAAGAQGAEVEVEAHLGGQPSPTLEIGVE